MSEEETKNESEQAEGPQSALEKVDQAYDHEERAVQLKAEAKDELQEYLSEALPFETNPSLTIRDGCFVVSCHPTSALKEVNEDLGDEIELLMPLQFKIGEENEELSRTDLVTTQREVQAKNLKQLISEIEEEYDDGAPVGEVLGRAYEVGLSKYETEHEIDKLKQQGEIYEPTSSTLRTT